MSKYKISYTVVENSKTVNFTDKEKDYLRKIFNNSGVEETYYNGMNFKWDQTMDFELFGVFRPLLPCCIFINNDLSLDFAATAIAFLSVYKNLYMKNKFKFFILTLPIINSLYLKRKAYSYEKKVMKYITDRNKKTVQSKILR